MQLQDWFVGGASASVGIIFWYWAIFDAEIAQRLKLARLVSSAYGRGGARVFYAILGTLLVLLGGIIASGFSFELIRMANPPPPPQLLPSIRDLR